MSTNARIFAAAVLSFIALSTPVIAQNQSVNILEGLAFTPRDSAWSGMADSKTDEGRIQFLSLGSQQEFDLGRDATAVIHRLEWAVTPNPERRPQRIIVRAISPDLKYWATAGLCKFPKEVPAGTTTMACNFLPTKTSAFAVWLVSSHGAPEIEGSEVRIFGRVDQVGDRSPTGSTTADPTAFVVEGTTTATFYQPMLAAKRLDICENGAGTPCFEPVAHSFCKAMGYDSAIVFKHVENAGETIWSKSMRICGPSCSAFELIECQIESKS